MQESVLAGLCLRFAHFQFPFRRDGPCDLPTKYILRSSILAFSSLFVGMGLAMQPIPGGPRTLQTAFSSLFVGMGLAMAFTVIFSPVSEYAFSSLFVGMGLAIEVSLVGKAANGKLSVPFSSGWALRWKAEILGQPGIRSFQFPFRRDGPCDSVLSRPRRAVDDSLSVPFSSGWALRLGLYAGRKVACEPAFSSLFVGMGLAIQVLARWLAVRESHFQFPFRRDGPCD